LEQQRELKFLCQHHFLRKSYTTDYRQELTLFLTGAKHTTYRSLVLYFPYRFFLPILHLGTTMRAKIFMSSSLSSPKLHNGLPTGA